MREFKISARYTVRTDSLSRYMTEISRYEALTPTQEAELAVLAREGDLLAKERLITSNLRFVISVAKMYAGRDSTKMEDLINEGNMGLLEAAEGFDPTTGFKFISYAVWFIRKNMLKYLTDNSRQIRVPSNQVSTISKINQLESKMAQDLQRDPTIDELFDAYLETVDPDAKIEGIKMALVANHAPTPMDGWGNDSDIEGDWGPINTINGDPEGADHLVITGSSDQMIERYLNKLTPVQKQIIAMRLGLFGYEPHSFTRIANQFGDFTPETIRQRYTKAIRKLKIIMNQARIRREL
jgi:RNA polymerase primary sigma factor